MKIYVMALIFPLKASLYMNNCIKRNIYACLFQIALLFVFRSDDFRGPVGILNEWYALSVEKIMTTILELTN